LCPPAALGPAVAELAADLLKKPAESLAIGKALFYRQLEVGLAAAYEDASRTIACNMASEVAKEGVDAFIAKRPPNWKS
jgi:enoyl-CoA hydratase/carnithine racemase